MSILQSPVSQGIVFNRGYSLVNNIVVRDDNSRNSDVQGDRADGYTMYSVACVSGKDNDRALVDGETSPPFADVDSDWIEASVGT